MRSIALPMEKNLKKYLPGNDLMKKILHVLANSPPDVNGYAVRTHGLMKAYSELPNIEVVGLTSPWYPDRESLIEMLELDEITSVSYTHLTLPTNSRV